MKVAYPFLALRLQDPDRRKQGAPTIPSNPLSTERIIERQADHETENGNRNEKQKKEKKKSSSTATVKSIDL